MCVYEYAIIFNMETAQIVKTYSLMSDDVSETI